MSKFMTVAVDGPGGAGKSSAAKGVAARTGLHYVDTGAMYRGLGLYVKEAGTDINDPEAVAEAIRELSVEVLYNEEGQQIIVGGRNMTPFIRTPEAGDAASRTSAYPVVREKLLDLQRGLADHYELIMDGRDIGTVIFPDADLKLFVTATPEERGRRRYQELLEKGQTDITLEGVIEDIRARDYRDSHRAAAPLRQAEDAIFLDTTELTLDEVIDFICGKVEEIRSKKAGAEA